jgi:uncharacterized protein (UPF0218 family)
MAAPDSALRLALGGYAPTFVRWHLWGRVWRDLAPRGELVHELREPPGAGTSLAIAASGVSPGLAEVDRRIRRQHDWDVYDHFRSSVLLPDGRLLTMKFLQFTDFPELWRRDNELMCRRSPILVPEGGDQSATEVCLHVGDSAGGWGLVEIPPEGEWKFDRTFDFGGATLVAGFCVALGAQELFVVYGVQREGVDVIRVLREPLKRKSPVEDPEALWARCSFPISGLAASSEPVWSPHRFRWWPGFVGCSPCGRRLYLLGSRAGRSHVHLVDVRPGWRPGQRPAATLVRTWPAGSEAAAITVTGEDLLVIASVRPYDCSPAFAVYSPGGTLLRSWDLRGDPLSLRTLGALPEAPPAASDDAGLQIRGLWFDTRTRELLVSAERESARTRTVDLLVYR